MTIRITVPAPDCCCWEFQTSVSGREPGWVRDSREAFGSNLLPCLLRVTWSTLTGHVVHIFSASSTEDPSTSSG